MTLLNSNASRAAIIRELQNLARNPSILPGDGIIIYFAGHGTEVLKERQGNGDSPRVQAILSQDANMDDVHPIPDFTLGFLIAAIHEAKGDNIVSYFH